MGVREGDTIISTNVEVRLDGLPYSNRSAPHDPGVAIYWKDSKGRKKCMAVDRYDRVADNIAAIAATLDGMRAIQRHGGAEILERTFLGFAQLPERVGRQWREVLGFGEGHVTKEDVDSQFKARARKVHSDHNGGGDELMIELNRARQDALVEVS